MSLICFCKPASSVYLLFPVQNMESDFSEVKDSYLFRILSFTIRNPSELLKFILVICLMATVF